MPFYVYSSLPCLLFLPLHLRTIVSFATLASYTEHKVSGNPKH